MEASGPFPSIWATRYYEQSSFVSGVCCWCVAESCFFYVLILRGTLPFVLQECNILESPAS